MYRHTSIQVTNPGLFSAGDMHDAHELAACDMYRYLDHFQTAERFKEHVEGRGEHHG